MKKGKRGERKCFLSAPYSMNHPTYHMLAPAILSTLPCYRRTTPYITAAEQQASPRTLRDKQQRIHTPANMIIDCLGNNCTMLLVNYTLKTFLRRFPCGCKLKRNNLYFYYCVSWREADRRNIYLK